MTVSIPETHLDLLTGPVTAILATIMPSDRPHATAIWCDYDGQYIWFVTDRDTQKVQNIEFNPMVSLLALDPANPYRYLEVRGMVEVMTTEGALTGLDALTRLYTGQPAYYGYVEPAEKAGQTVQVLCKIRPLATVAYNEQVGYGDSSAARPASD